MMENSFEKQVSNKLKNTQVQPSEHLLDSIFEKRAAKAKRFAFYPFAGALLGVALLSVIGYWLWQSNDSKTAQQLGQQSELPLESGNGQGGLLPQKDNDQIVSMPATAQKSKVSTPTQRAKKSSISAHNKGVVPFKRSVAQKGFNSDQSSSKTISSNAGFENQYFNVSKENRPSIQKSEHQGNSHLYVYQTVSDEAMVSRDFLFSRIARLRKLSVKKNLESLEMVASTPIKRNGLEKSKRPIFIDFLFNPGVNMPNVQGANPLAEASQSVLKPSYGQGFGLRISVPVSARWNVFSGLSYKEQSNDYRGDLSYLEERTQINQHIRYINDPLKGVLKVTSYDTVNVMVSKNQAINFKNQYKIFQIPVGFSYNFGYKKFEFAINGSALFNSIKQSSGRNINLDQHITNEYRSDKAVFGFGAGLSLMSAMKVSNRIRLIAEPGLQYYGLKSLQFGNKVGEKALGVQMTIGLRYTVF